MKNEEYIMNAFIPTELTNGCFFNWDGRCRILTESFIQRMSEHIEFDDVKVILDVGSRDACQSLEFNRWFPNAKIYAFEPVPSNIEWCQNNVKDVDNIQIVPKAVTSFNGKTKFYQVVNGNVGASSLYQKTEHWWSKAWNQHEIEVECVRLNDWLIENKIEKVDLMWVDAQGAEKDVFEGMGNYLSDVDGIATEVELEQLYQGATLKDDLDRVLVNNFKLVDSKTTPHNAEADVIFINKKYL